MVSERTNLSSLCILASVDMLVLFSMLTGQTFDTERLVDTNRVPSEFRRVRSHANTRIATVLMTRGALELSPLCCLARVGKVVPPALDILNMNKKGTLMATISVGHQVYLYRLFVRELGVGRQTPVARVDEVLAADDIMPCDLGCADTRELLECLSDFVRLTVFKKGRAYATVVAQPAWDEALARAEKEGTAKRPAEKGAKTWKRKRNRGEVQPVRPRPKNRPKPVEEPAEKPEAATESAATEQAAVENPAGTESLATAGSEAATSEAAAAEVAEDAVTTSDTERSMAAESAAMAMLESATTPADAGQSAATEAIASTEPGAVAKSVATTAADTEQTSTATTPAEQRKTTQAEVDEFAQATQTGLEAVAQATPKQPVATTVEELIAGKSAASAEPADDHVGERVEASAAVTQEEPATQLAAKPKMEDMPTPGHDSTPAQRQNAAHVTRPEVASTPASASAPAQTTVPAKTSKPTFVQASRPAPVSKPAPAPTTSQQEHPRSFAEQVQLSNEQLSALYQVLPLDVDPMELLDEDWRVARSTSSFTQQDGIVTFPLRYVRTTDGKPVRVSMKRGAPTTSGKRWIVINVEGELNVALEGLPVTGIDATRELAQFAILGPWDKLVVKLDQLRAPAFGPTDAELQEYLSITFHRVRLENKLVTYANGTHLAFDTGLLTTEARSILMCFDAHEGDIAWEFADFRTVGQASAGAQEDKDSRTKSNLEPVMPVPEPASYLTSLADVTIASEADVRVRKELVNTYGPQLEAAAQVALRRVRRDYRLGTPAYDPVANQLRLLVPLCLEDEHRADHALVLTPSDGQHAYVASAVLSLERAATCARVVSLELPRWLDSTSA